MIAPVLLTVIVVAYLGMTHPRWCRRGPTGSAFSAPAEVRTRPDRAAWLLPITVVLSNLVSKVPAVMLLLPHAGGRYGWHEDDRFRSVHRFSRRAVARRLRR